MSYDDGRVACTDDALVIRRYYFPFGDIGDKRIPYSSIKGVRRERLGVFTGWGRIWGSSDLVHWLNFDPTRLGKHRALIIHLSGMRIVPVITPDDVDAVAAELAGHGVTVTGDS